MSFFPILFEASVISSVEISTTFVRDLFLWSSNKDFEIRLSLSM
jgi:hypothetical protein